MDNNFNNILSIFKRLDETGAYPFAGQAVGQKPGDQVRGTEKATAKASGEHPFKGRLVGASESIETECDAPVSLADKLRARWEQTKREKGLAEAGANNPAQGTTAGGAPTAPGAIDPKELANTQQNLNKLKSAGVPIPNVTQAAKTVMKDPSDPTTPMSAQDKQVNANLGLAMKNLLDKGNPSQVGQVAAAIKQAQQGQ